MPAMPVHRVMEGRGRREETVASASCAAVPGATVQGSSARPTATGAPPETGAAMPASALPGPTNLLCPYFLGDPRGRSPLGRMYEGLDRQEHDRAINRNR